MATHMATATAMRALQIINLAACGEAGIAALIDLDDRKASGRGKEHRLVDGVIAFLLPPPGLRDAALHGHTGRDNRQAARARPAVGPRPRPAIVPMAAPRDSLLNDGEVADLGLLTIEVRSVTELSGKDCTAPIDPCRPMRTRFKSARVAPQTEVL